MTHEPAKLSDDELQQIYANWNPGDGRRLLGHIAWKDSELAAANAENERLTRELGEAKEDIAYNKDYEGERHELYYELLLYQEAAGQLSDLVNAAQQRLASLAVDPADKVKLGEMVREGFNERGAKIELGPMPDWHTKAYQHIGAKLFAAGRLSRDPEVSELVQQIAELNEKLEAAHERIKGQCEQIGNHGRCITRQRETIKRFKADRDRLAAELATTKQALADAQQSLNRTGHGNAWTPDVCPITGREFFGWIKDEHGQYHPTYGDARTCYTIPVLDAANGNALHDRDLVSRKYDHDLGGWTDYEIQGVRLIDDERLVDLLEAESELKESKQALADARAEVERVKDEHEKLGGEFGCLFELADSMSDLVYGGECAWSRESVKQGAKELKTAVRKLVKNLRSECDSARVHLADARTAAEQLIATAKQVAVRLKAMPFASDRDHGGMLLCHTENLESILNPSPAPAKPAASEPIGLCPKCGIQPLTKEGGDMIRLGEKDYLCGNCKRYLCRPMEPTGAASEPDDSSHTVETAHTSSSQSEPADHSGEANEKVEQHLCPDCNQPLTCLASDGSARVSHCNSCDCTVGNSLPLTKEAIDTMEAIVRHAEESHRDADREVAEHAERRFVCPHCGERRYIAERIGVTTGPEAFEYCCPKGHKSTWAEVEAAKDGPITAATTDIRKIVEKSNATDAGNQAAEVEAANGEREQGNPCAGIFDHKWLDPVCVGGGCQSLVLARVSEELKAEVEWRSLGIKSRDALILRLKQQLAAATQAREAEKQRADDTQVRLEAFERSPDKKQKSIWELEEAVSEAEERANENARLLHEQRQRAEAAEAAAGVMKSALTKGDELNLNNNRGVSVYDALRRLRDGSMSTPDNSWFGWAFDRIDKALATDPGRAANELRAGKALAGKIRDALCSVEAIAHVERALADYDQALAQGEQCGEVR